MAELAHKLRLEVVTPAGQALRTDADAVDLTSVLGEFEVLPGHLPVLVALKCGPFRWRQGPKVHRAALGEGFAEARPDAVIVLADKFEPTDKIDVPDAQTDLAKAEDGIKAWQHVQQGGEFATLARERDWAQARIDVMNER